MHVASAQDETLIKALNTYHRECLSSNTKIAERLASDYDIHVRCAILKSRGFAVLIIKLC